MAASVPVVRLFCLITFVVTVTTVLSSFEVDISPDGSRYLIKVDNKTWMNSGETWFNAQHKTFSVTNGTLKFQKKHSRKAVDFMGEYNETAYVYNPSTSSNFSIEIVVKTYLYSNVAIFSQRYRVGAEGTRGRNSDDVIGSFPSFRIPSEIFDKSEVDLGYVAPGNDMAGWVNLAVGKWTSESANFSTGIQGGPLVLFDEWTNAIVVSPLNHFTALSNVKNSKGRQAQISWGIMGGVDAVPEGYQADFIVYYSNKGINEAVRGWGSYITKLYGKTSDKRDKDLTVTHLGYWTDNGAYYYYNTERGKNYEDTILDVVDYLRKIEVPVKYLQIDSWFYKKGHVDGTHSWTPMAKIFPHGFDYLYEKTNLPIGCHNRYWDNDTIYASVNGGKYPFISDKQSGQAVVSDQHFWSDLFKNSTRNWGKFILYEQDWFNQETERDIVLLTDIGLAEQWLKHMGLGADQNDVSIQYCMEFCRHILQSVEIRAVTQARASDDYKPGNEQFRIGVSSMFLDALKLAPSKDTFWTTSYQPGNRYNASEKTPFMQTLMATLSKGPVGPGDGIGYMNKTLIMKCCDSDGKILKPTRPATAMDRSLQRLAFDESDVKCAGYRTPKANDEFVYTTHASVSGYYFLTLVAGFVKTPYNVTTGLGWPGLPIDNTDYVIYNATNGHLDGFHHMNHSNAFSLGPGCSASYCLFQASPIIWRKETGGIAFFGEVDKFVPLSPQRFSFIRYGNPSDIKIGLNVNAGEIVNFTFFQFSKSTFQTVVCDNSKGAQRMSRTFMQFTANGTEALCFLRR